MTTDTKIKNQAQYRHWKMLEGRIQETWPHSICKRSLQLAHGYEVLITDPRSATPTHMLIEFKADHLEIALNNAVLNPIHVSHFLKLFILKEAIVPTKKFEIKHFERYLTLAQDIFNATRNLGLSPQYSASIQKLLAEISANPTQ